jgi:Pvc16 N-terminal domain
MSNALAIAAVTETLVTLLQDNIGGAHIGSALVSNLSPDLGQTLPAVGVNVFLYQVTPNAALRNADLPTRAADGITLLRKPTAALDLHYLLTFYGDDKFLEPQRLLGAVTLYLHANPTLQRSQIQPVAIDAHTSVDSNLANQPELVRFTPVAFSLEELSKLWSFLFKIDYVLSTAYVASVVLIETDDATPPPALPVVSINLAAQTMRQPVITQVTASPNANGPIIAGGDIALNGRLLTAPEHGVTQVLIGGAAQTPASIAPNRITLPLPSGLAAGPQTAQILQPLMLGVPPVLHPGTGTASGIASFVLSPVIAPAATPSGFAIELQTAVSPPGQVLAVTLLPKVLAGQRALLQMLPNDGSGAARLFDGGTIPADTDTVTFPITGLPSGTYAVRVLIDGAQSPLVPVAPTITI